jgi:hypothetical protein
MIPSVDPYEGSPGSHSGSAEEEEEELGSAEETSMASLEGVDPSSEIDPAGA